MFYRLFIACLFLLKGVVVGTELSRFQLDQSSFLILEESGGANGKYILSFQEKDNAPIPFWERPKLDRGYEMGLKKLTTAVRLGDEVDAAFLLDDMELLMVHGDLSRKKATEIRLEVGELLHTSDGQYSKEIILPAPGSIQFSYEKGMTRKFDYGPDGVLMENGKPYQSPYQRPMNPPKPVASISSEAPPEPLVQDLPSAAPTEKPPFRHVDVEAPASSGSWQIILIGFFLAAIGVALFIFLRRRLH